MLLYHSWLESLGAEGDSHLPHLTSHFSLDEAQITVGFLECKHTLSTHILFFIHHSPQVLLYTAAFNLPITWSTQMFEIDLIQVQQLALGLIKLHDVQVGFQGLCNEEPGRNRLSLNFTFFLIIVFHFLFFLRPTIIFTLVYFVWKIFNRASWAYFYYPFS